MRTREKLFTFDPVLINNLDTTTGVGLPDKKKWNEILASASNLHLKIIIYIDEAGDHLMIDNIRLIPPASFRGKLLAFLFRRFKHFKGAPDKGVTIVCSKTIDNGENLEAVLLELAHRNNLDPLFLDWIENSNNFI